MTRRRAIFLVIFALLAILPGVLYLLAGSPFVLDRALEAARSAGIKLDVAQVRGNLLDGRFEAEDLKLALPGVSGSARKVKVSYSPWALLQRQVRLRVSLEGANVRLDPAKLGAASGGEAPPVSVILEAVDLKDSRVSLDGRGWFIPNVSAVILEQTPDDDSGQGDKGLLGTLKARLSTPDGAGVVTAKYKVAEDGQFRVDLDGDLDARIARYWFDGIRAGRLAAKYTISSESFFGEGVISGGVVEPLPGLVATQIAGTVKHTSNGHVIGKLTGVGLEGPVTANVDVNIPKSRWDVTGQLEPKLGLALKYFFPGVTGSGRSTVTVRGGGWSSVKLEGELLADGEVVGLPLRGARGTWTARVPSRQGEPVFVLDVNANAATELFGGTVNLAAKVNYADGKASVNATARGKVLARDLALTSKITTGTGGVRIAASGNGFGGDLNARATILDSRMIGAGRFENLNFDLPLEHSLSGRFDLGGKIGALEARGDFSRAKLIVPGVLAKDWPGAFVFRQQGSGITGDLNLRNESSSLVLKGDLARGKIVASDVQLEPGGLANVTANYDLSGKPKLEGQARLREIAVGGFSLQDVAGPWQLTFNDGVRGGWTTPQLILEYTGNRVKAQTKNWQGQFFNEAIKLTGGLEYGLETGLITGVQRGVGRLGQVIITGRGKTLELAGDLRYQALRAKLEGVAQLQPFSLEASSLVTSDLDPNLRGTVQADLSKGVRVTGQVTSASGKPLNLSYTDGQFSARGGLDLRTLEVALPPELRGQFAGVADLDVRGSSIENAGGTAQISGRYGDFPIAARVGLQAGQVTTDATLTGGDWRGARVVGAVYPGLNARVSYRELSARVTGLANAFGFSLRGTLPELPIWQSQNLELLRPDVALDGRFENAALTASGRVGNLGVSKLEFGQNQLKASYNGDLNIRYAKELIQARGLEGDVRVDLGVDQRVNLNALIAQLEGSVTGQKFNASGVDVRLNQKDGFSIAGSVERLTARVAGQNIRANGLELKALQNRSQSQAWTGNGNIARLETKIPGQSSGQLTRLVDVDFTAASSVDGQLKATARAARGITSYGAFKAWLEPVTVGVTRSMTGKDKFEITANSKLEGQALTESFGGSVSGRASLPFEPNKWDADVRLNLQGDTWNLNANGPLEDARVYGRLPSRFLALAGVSVPKEFLAPVAFDTQVNARELAYRGSLSSTLDGGYRLNASVNGRRERFNATLEALDGANGWARVNYSSGQTLGLKTGSGRLEAKTFNLEPYVGSAVKLDANLSLNRDRLEGTFSSELAGIPVQGNWRNGGFTGTLGGSVPVALRSPSYRFPLEFTPLEWKTTSNDLPFAANGSLKLQSELGLLPRAEGELRLKRFGVDVPGGRAQLEPQPIKLAAQFRTAPTNTGLELTLTSPGSNQPVRFTNNRWQGDLAVPYSLWKTTGKARVTLEGPFEGRAWTSPNFKLETSGPLQAKASGTLEDWTANANLDLNGIQGDLNEEWRGKIKPGSLEVNATGSILPAVTLAAKLSNLETSVDGQGVTLEADASFDANEWRATGDLWAMGSAANLTSGKDSSASFRAGNDGGWLELNRLDLGLLRAFGLEASGTATGRVSLPEWTGERVFGALQFDRASLAGITANGQLEVNAGQYQANLSGVLPGDLEYSIDGSIAPRLEAEFVVDDLRGTASGQIKLEDVRQSKIRLEAAGQFLKRQASLDVTLDQTRLAAVLAWDAARLRANARWIDDQRGPTRVNALIGTGRLEVNDLKGLAGIDGKLSSDLRFENLNLLAKNLRANIAGFDLAASASFDGSQVNASEFRAQGQGLKANGSGLVWPKLNVALNGSSILDYAPGSFSGQASGSVEKPVIDLKGALSAAKIGLNADGTALTARLENNMVSLGLKGSRLNGTARANLNALAGEEPLRALEAFDLQLDTELLSPGAEPISGPIEGKLGWTAKSGFVGRLKADGELLESPALASVEGRAGRLEAALNWRDGILRANIPGNLERNLDGTVQLERFDLGALWGRPDRLRLQADGQLIGSWLSPKANMRGTLTDAKGEFSSALELGYDGGSGRLNLTGAHLLLQGEIDAKGWRANGQTTLLRLNSDLLPDSFNLPEVELGLTTMLEASQRFSDGANSLNVRATNLRAVGTLEPIGDFELAGSANLVGNRLSTSAKLRALEGEVSFDGTLGLNAASRERLNISARDISLERFGLTGLLAASGNVTGTVSDPNIRADLQLERFGPADQDWWASATAKLDGRLLDPNVRADLQLAGTGSGRSSVRIRDLFKPAPVVAWQGTANIPGLRLEGSLDGPWPLLNGNATLKLDGAPKAISSLNLNARAGVLAISTPSSQAAKLAPFLLGQVRLVPGQGLSDVRLDGTLRLNAKLDQLVTSVGGNSVGGNSAGVNSAGGNITGDLLVSGQAFAPELKLNALLSQLEVGGFNAPDLKLSADYNIGSPLTAIAQYEGGEARLEAGVLNLTGLKLTGPAFEATIKARGQVLNGLAFDPDLRLDADLTGTLSGTLRGTYVRDVRTVDLFGIELRGAAYGATLVVDAQASSLDGWTGTVQVTGLPALAPTIPGSAIAVTNTTASPTSPSVTPSVTTNNEPLLGSINATLDGKFAAPSLNGSGLIAGAGVRLQAQLNPLAATLNLENVPGGPAISGGAISLKDGSLSGKLEYALENLKLGLVASGSLERPAANLSISRDTLTANADLNLNAGKVSGEVRLGDGKNAGKLRLENDRLIGNVPLLNLGSFGLEGFGGQVGLETDLLLLPNLAGRANLVWKNLRTPFELPALGFRIDGSGNAEIDPQSSSLIFSSEGTPGSVSGAFSWRETQPSGSARLSLRGPGGRGAIIGEVSLARGNLSGRAQAANLDLNLMGLKVAASGNLSLDGLEFKATGQAQALGGRITLSNLGGNLEEFVPGLSALLGREASEESQLGLQVQARLDGIKLEEVPQFKTVLPNAKGRVSGVVGLSGGIGTFGLTVPQLHLPTQASKTNLTGETDLRLRISGTTADGDIRYRGEFDGAQGFETGGSGASSFNGDLTSGILSGKLELRHAPIHALLGSVFGSLPGVAYVTGAAKYAVPLDQLTQGRVELIAENLELSGGGDALRGTLAAVYDKGGLTLNRLALDGAGSWRGSGRYTPDGVDLKLSFQDTSFTPVLGLIPNLRDLNPSATGSVQLEFSGAYQKPNAILQANNIQASIAGIELASNSISGTLNEGALELAGIISSGGAVGGSLNATANATVTSYSPIKVENLRAKANGSLTVAPIGKLENVIAEINGESGGFQLRAKGSKGGPFTVEGPLSDRLDLKLKGQNLEISLPDFFIKDGLVNADLRLLQEGAKYRVTGDIAASRITSSTSIPRPEKNAKTSKAERPSEPVPLLKRIELDRVRLIAPNGVRFSEPNLNLSLEAGGTLTMTNTLGEPKISGTLEALERGDRTRGSFNLAGFAYSIQDGKAAFNPLNGVYPVITARGRTEVPILNPRPGQAKRAVLELQVVLRFRSQTGGVLIDAETKLTQYRSNGSPCPTDPNPQFEPDCLSQSEALGLIALGNGNDFNDPSKLASGISTGALNQILNAFVLREFSNAFTQATGINFNVSTNAAEAIVGLFGTDRKSLTLDFSVGGYITRDFYLEAFLGTTLNTNGFALTWTSEDNLFGVRYFQPVRLGATSSPNFNLFSGSELRLSYNLSRNASVNFGLAVGDPENTAKFSIGGAWRF